jgi:TPR repeat protein
MRDYDRAREFFNKALEVDSDDTDSNYYMGLIYLLGLGVEVNVEKALNYFMYSQKDDRSLNALGYIYYKAPDYLDMTKPEERIKYGSIGRNIKKAKIYFEKAS